MRFGAMNFPILPVIDEIHTVADLGMDYIELTMDPPMAHFEQILEQKTAIIKALSDNGLGLVCHMPSFVHTADLTESIRRASVTEVIRSLETAADLKAEKAILHPGYINGLAAHVKPQVIRLALESLIKIARRAETLGIVLCLENLFPRFSPFVTADDFKPLFSALPEVKLVLDVGHAFIGDKGDRRWQDFLIQYGNRLEHVHLSDNFGVRDDHLPLGAGTIAYQQVAKALRRLGYNKTITLEIFVEDRTVLTKSMKKIIALML